MKNKDTVLLEQAYSSIKTQSLTNESSLDPNSYESLISLIIAGAGIAGLFKLKELIDNKIKDSDYQNTQHSDKPIVYSDPQKKDDFVTGISDETRAAQDELNRRRTKI
jgi:hypothetical protein